MLYYGNVFLRRRIEVPVSMRVDPVLLIFAWMMCGGGVGEIGKWSFLQWLHCLSCANQSDADPVPFHCQSVANLTSIERRSDVDHLMICQYTWHFLCQFTQIWCQLGTNLKTIYPNLMPIWCGWSGNPSQSDHNPVPNYYNAMTIRCQSSPNPSQSHANPVPILV